MKLVDEKTGLPLQRGQSVRTFRGEIVTLVDWYEPGTSAGGSGGRVRLSDEDGSSDEFSPVYFPSVIGAKWVEDTCAQAGRAVIVEEIPGKRTYRWFVSGLEISLLDPRRQHFIRDGRYSSPKFWELADAKVWCADRGLRWVVEECND